MRIFITGSNGQLAKSIISELPNDELILASRKTLDTTDRKAVFQQITESNPDIIFHFASMTRGEECAKNPEEAYRINVTGTKNIVDICKKNGITLLFVSTNEVFNGKSNSPYSTKHKPDPITVVGKTKLEAENIIRLQLKKYFIIRTSWLYSNWSHNFIHAVLKKAINDKKIELVDDEIGSPTYSQDLAYAVRKIIKTKKYGVYHIANEGAISRLEFAKKAFQIYGIKDVEVVAVHLDHFKRLSKPPLYSALKNSNLKSLDINMKKWDNALRRFLTTHDLLKPLSS